MYFPSCFRHATIVALWIMGASGAVHAAGIALEHAWAQVSPPRATVGRAFVTIVNHSAEIDHLVGVSTDAAKSAEIDGIRILNDVSSTRRLFNLDIPPGHSIEFTPGAYHILMRNLKQPLVAGATFRGELVFEKAGAIPVEFRVTPNGPPPL
jgi:hypothetical protein